MNVAIFLHQKCWLLLERANEDVTDGYVVNGNWWFTRIGRVFLAKDSFGYTRVESDLPEDTEFFRLDFSLLAHHNTMEDYLDDLYQNGKLEEFRINI